MRRLERKWWGSLSRYEMIWVDHSRSITKSSCYQDALDLARWFQAQVRPRSRKRSSLVMAGFPRVSRSFLGPFYRGWSAWNIFAMVDRRCWLVLICVVGMFNMFQSCSIIFGIVRENEPWMTSIFAQGSWSHKPSSFGSRFQGCMGHGSKMIKFADWNRKKC